MLELVLLSVLCQTPSTTTPTTPIDGPRARIASLREEVAGLRHELELLRQGEREEVATFARKKSEADAEVLRLRLVLRGVQQRQQDLVAQQAGERDVGAARRAALVTFADRAERAILAGIPVRRVERLRALQQVRDAIAASAPTAATTTTGNNKERDAAAALLELVKRELQLAEQVERTRLPVPTVAVDGAPAAPETLRSGVRLGTLAFFFEDGGKAWVLLRGAHAPAVLDDEDQRAAVHELVQAFERDDRHGTRAVPNLLALLLGKERP